MDFMCDESAAKRRRIEREAGESSSSPSDDQPAQEHEVFLSFRGPDTRKEFAAHLYSSLDSAGIRVFRDNEKLHVGEEIGPQLIKGIEQSKISIPIFSKGYASSKWCLTEFATMMKLRERGQQKILPIFYDVSPNEVQHQSSKEFLEAFANHENAYEAETVLEWRTALSKVGALKGWEKKEVSNGDGAVLVDKVVGLVRKILKKSHIVLPDTIVGIEGQVDAVLDLLEVNATDVRIVGIWGMGGIGKTTLADVIYNQIVDQFDCSGFLKDIREKASHHHGLEFLQGTLVAQLSRAERRGFNSVSDGIMELRDRFRGKKVLILLDDIDHKRQLDALGVGIDWFGRGSRVIITTRDQGVLKTYTNKIYDVKELKEDQALQLFYKHAFKADSPLAELRTMSENIVKKTGGLPLALEVIGGFLAEQDRDIWESMLEKLEKIPHEDVESKLMISYEALTDRQKYIFLDIACFYIGEDMRVVSYVWKDHFRFSPACEIHVLRSRSFIKIRDGNKLWMHDQLRDLGRAIVEKENSDPGKRILLWRNDDAREFLDSCEGLPNVEAICLDHNDDDPNLTDQQCRQLPNLRYMRLSLTSLLGDFQNLLSKLKWLKCYISPMKKVSKLSLKNLIVLSISRSTIDDWKWCSKQVAPKLKVLDLSWCSDLRTLDFSLFPNLERLDLSCCHELRMVDSSIGKFKSLVYLNLSLCLNIRELPHEMSALTSLVELDVSRTHIKDIPLSQDMKQLEILRATKYCNLLMIPDCVGNMTSLRELVFDVCMGIKELPESIENLKNLERLIIKSSPIRSLPSGLWKLEKLRVIDVLGDESLEEEIPTDIGMGRLSHLEVLKIRATDFCSLPIAIDGLSHLHTLHLNHPSWDRWPWKFGHIPRLETLPKLPVSLTSAVVTCKSMLPIPNLSLLTNLQELEFQSCVGMTEITQDISKLTRLRKLYVMDCPLLTEIQGLENLKLLRALVIANCTKLHRLEGFDGLERLQLLNILKCEAIQRLPNLSKLNCLEILQVRGCEELKDLEGFDGLEALVQLDISNCKTIKQLRNLSNLKYLWILTAAGCEELQVLEGLSGLEAMEILNISSCKAIKRLSNLSNLKRLVILEADGCDKLQDFEGLDGLETLKILNISDCKVIKRLPNLSNLKCLWKLQASGCEQLQDLEGLDGLEVLEHLDISDCKAIKRLPDLSNLKCLWKLHANGCDELQILGGFDWLEALNS